MNQIPQAPRGKESAFSHSETLDVWLSYSQQRFEDANHRVEDYRSWARQMVAWIAVIVALELNLLPKISETAASLERFQFATWVILAVAILGQMICLTLAARMGYSTVTLRSPENPKVLFEHLQRANPEAAKKMIAAYFANSYDEYHGVAQGLSRRFGKITAGFVVTVWMAVVASCYVFVFSEQGNQRLTMENQEDQTSEIPEVQDSGSVPSAPDASGEPSSEPSEPPEPLATPTEGELINKERIPPDLEKR